ncbi:hypothetical protein MVLG_04626 [Microbotryum lychnidis-dioicae p1A1 Lamole]|uniref:Cryptochrome DASH n=1 Tax=Microbotryum lychnidis-dioicae (strain p1A1 Lamole / MvSl-1064) TaxID=683840 RepID=U5HBT2_USTV1|nr:hypothetical protein MVLG_04626 [Microbotryum lychnidis-dioicae p1A1 Lamole]|eukprot:KDE04978.1 hypothetical protein MVLG_04626 [Microbotryum lychnidis-dioicae p1A1 Lamole]
MARKVIVALMRNDLRIHDQALFHAAHSQNNTDVTHLLPLYVFDERQIELSALPDYQRQGPEARTRIYKFWRTGVYRAKFITEAVYDLKQSLQQRNSDLLVRFGQTEHVIAQIVQSLQDDGAEVKKVLMQKEFCTEELAVERRTAKLLGKNSVQVQTFDTSPLLDVRDLPFSIQECPDVFTPFRKRVEGRGQLGRAPLEMLSKFKPFPALEQNSAPLPGYGDKFDKSNTVDAILPHLLKPLDSSSATAYSAPSHTPSDKSAFPFAGGETSALKRMDWYFHQGKPPPVARYKETRNGLLGHEYSTKFSPFLCFGMLSPRLVMQSLDEHEAKFGSSQNTYWVRFEILWRDYFMFISRKYGSKLFTLGGFESVTDPKQAQIKTKPGWWKSLDNDGPRDQPAIRWLEGRTGVPFIDANMAELRGSGFMSNRGRQNVASFLTKDLQVDWRLGAEFFESHLVDYEPTANYGNWQYVGGVGNDPRASRQFNPIKQANDYDPLGTYIKTWLPELANVPSHRIQAPWILSADEKKRFVTGDYPESPVIEQSSWKKHYFNKGPGKTHGNKNERIKNPCPAKNRQNANSNGGGKRGEQGGHGEGEGGHHQQ